jgi:hypothetical protein
MAHLKRKSIVDNAIIHRIEEEFDAWIHLIHCKTDSDVPSSADIVFINIS